VTQRHDRWGPFGHLPPGGGLSPTGGGFPGNFPVPGRNGVERPIDDTRIGNVEKLAGFAPGTPVTAYPKKRLLDISLQKIAGLTGSKDAQFEAGSWVLAIQANVTGKWLGADPANVAVCPLLAKIEMGTGTTTINVEVSPFPSASIPLPCDHVIVEVTWDPFRPEDYIAGGAGFLIVPAEVTVSATVQRSTGSSDARRVFVAKQDAVGVSLLSRVPAMAKGAMVYSNLSAEVYAAAAQWRLRAADPNEEITTGTAGIITTYTGVELGAIRNAGELADVPGAARWWIYTAPSIAGGPVFVDYEIGL
jgi:hypothetical protein